MAKSVNKSFLLGRIGKDPEIRSSQAGMVFANFTMATSDRRKDGNGEWVDTTEWHNLLAIGRTAEIVRDYVSKGDQLMVVGKIQTRSWDDQQTGTKKYKTEILIEELTLLGGAKKDGGSSSGSTYQSSEITDDDIPF